MTCARFFCFAALGAVLGFLLAAALPSLWAAAGGLLEPRAQLPLHPALVASFQVLASLAALIGFDAPAD